MGRGREAAAAHDLGAGGLQPGAHGVAVVDDEPEVAVLVGRLTPRGGEGEELVAEVDERHRGADAAA